MKIFNRQLKISITL